MRNLAVLAGVCLAVSGCGGGNPSVACDDAAFVGQQEEVYVALATAQNAAAAPGGPTVIADLRRGADLLARWIEEHPPCDGKLVELAAREREAVARLRSAADALEAGSDASADLEAAITALAAVEVELRS